MLFTGPSLVFTEQQHELLKAHLLPGDGLEAAAIVLCRDAGLERIKLLASQIILVPHEVCARTPVQLTWPGQYISDAIDVAEAGDLTIILIHSHPTGFRGFSDLDDRSDGDAFQAIFRGWSNEAPRGGHGSAIMLPDGEVICRLYDSELVANDIEQVQVVGHNIHYYWKHSISEEAPMAFGREMTKSLGRLHACIVGVSGTGSVVAEQAARMGFGKLSLIDFDRVEEKNLNRILNSTLEDARTKALKVEMFAAALALIRPDLEVTAISSTIADLVAIEAAANADIIFCCVDSSEGRHIADRIAQTFMVPLIDMGVTIPTRRRTDGKSAIADVLGRVDYVFPGGSTLGDRGVYTAASLRADYLRRVAPDTFVTEQQAGYIKGVIEEAPSVIALNMRAASAAMLEFLARAFPFRHSQNSDYARTIFTFAEGEEDHFNEATFMKSGIIAVGAGKLMPLLGLPSIEG